jgi:hypothetical protein
MRCRYVVEALALALLAGVRDAGGDGGIGAEVKGVAIGRSVLFSLLCFFPPFSSSLPFIFTLSPQLSYRLYINAVTESTVTLPP